MPTLYSQVTSAVLWHLRRQHDLIFRQSLLQQILDNACATVSRLAQHIQWGICSTQPLACSPGGSSTIWREGEGKKNPNRDVCTCCSLLAGLGVLLKDWDICRAGGAAAAGARPVRGWSSCSAGGWECAQPGGRAARPGSRYPERTQTDVIKIQA